MRFCFSYWWETSVLWVIYIHRYMEHRRLHPGAVTVLRFLFSTSSVHDSSLFFRFSCVAPFREPFFAFLFFLPVTYTVPSLCYVSLFPGTSSTLSSAEKFYFTWMQSARLMLNSICVTCEWDVGYYQHCVLGRSGCSGFVNSTTVHNTFATAQAIWFYSNKSCTGTTITWTTNG